MNEVVDLLPSLITGLSVAIPTVVALKVEVKWLKHEIGRLDDAIIRAHQRIDSMDKVRS